MVEEKFSSNVIRAKFACLGLVLAVASAGGQPAGATDCQTFPDVTICSDGRVFQHFDDLTFAPGGVIYHRFGDVTIDNRGNVWHRIGPFTLGPDGSRCKSIGDYISCKGGDGTIPDAAVMLPDPSASNGSDAPRHGR